MYPINQDKYACQALYGAQEIVAYRKQIGRTPRLEQLEAILFCLERGLQMYRLPGSWSERSHLAADAVSAA